MSYLQRMKLNSLNNLDKMLIKYWCSDCDNALVNPQDPTTGTFYEVYGHVRKYPSQQDGTINYGDEELVIIALCPKCDD